MNNYASMMVLKAQLSAGSYWNESLVKKTILINRIYLLLKGKFNSVWLNHALKSSTERSIKNIVKSLDLLKGKANIEW